MTTITITVRNQSFDLDPAEARALRDQLLDRLRADLDRRHDRRPLSREASQILNYVHNYMELNRVAPSRADTAEKLGYKDKKSIRPFIEELTAAGWMQQRRGHRSDNWGGDYRRPTSPPFRPVFESDQHPQKGGSAYEQPELIRI